MRKNIIRLAVLCAVFAIILACAGCTTTSKGETTIREPDENFLGDFKPFQLDNCMAVTKSLSGTIIPKEMEMYFAPRQNTVEAYFSYGMDKIAVVFTLEERVAFKEGIMAYMEAYNAGNLPERAPDRKNYFTRTPVTVAWGVMGLSYSADTYVRINYEYLERGKPYFVATFESANAKKDDTASPKMDIYFTPSQLEALLETIDQDEFQARVDELNRQAYEW